MLPITRDYIRFAWLASKLSRLDTSLLIFLSAFIPLQLRSGQVSDSLGKTLPLLFIGMCTFIANDLDDIESDRINHPNRPLPSDSITPALATTLYFICLMLALFTTKFYVPESSSYLYYFLLVLTISYGYVVSYVPAVKSFYVATISCVPVLIVASFYPSIKGLYLVAVAAFLFVMGRELCMDILDRHGDRYSSIHRISPNRLAVAAIGAQATGLLLLATQVEAPPDLTALLLLVLLLLACGLLWFKFAHQRAAVALMKAQLLIAIYFLT
jgi:geranylgeranylglycerol-phosphate geranylgeranyltransferase